MTRKVDEVGYSILTDVSHPQGMRYATTEYCVHKDELANHINTAAHSYAPVRYLRMGAFYIGYRENFLSRLLISTFVHSLGEREKNNTLCLWAMKGGE